MCVQLDNLPENSPISIVQTPIPITSSVPKRAKSQRKKALAAALATAQEYSEISMEQKKLQVQTLSVCRGVSWTSHLPGLKNSMCVCVFRRLWLKQQVRRAGRRCSWIWATCWRHWRNSNRPWEHDNSTTPNHCHTQVQNYNTRCIHIIFQNKSQLFLVNVPLAVIGNLWIPTFIQNESLLLKMNRYIYSKHVDTLFKSNLHVFKRNHYIFF